MRRFVCFSNVKFKKRENYPWKSVTFSKVPGCNFTKNNTPTWMFSRFLNCTNATKSHKASQMHFLKLCQISQFNM